MTTAVESSMKDKLDDDEKEAVTRGVVTLLLASGDGGGGSGLCHLGVAQSHVVLLFGTRVATLRARTAGPATALLGLLVAVHLRSCLELPYCVMASH